MELVFVALVCSISLGLGVWGINTLTPGLEESKKLSDRSNHDLDKKEK